LRRKNCAQASASPASEAVWVITARRACPLRPSTNATTPIRRSRERAASRSHPRRSASDSTISPSAETRSDASSASATWAMPTCAALPTATTECSGSPMSAMVTLIAIDDDWDTTATPRSPAGSPTPPCWSGQISAWSA
jgi:hypothetical protein